MMLDHYYAVIMAGGGGTRLWPLSRHQSPKQMLKLFGDRTLFQVAVDRLQGLLPPERILVVTVADQAAQLQKSRPEIPAENYLLEPMPRGTASVVGLAMVALKQRDPEAVMAILTADHYIQNEEGFRQILSAAYDVATDGYLVTLGIHPTYPATGYGYIQQGQTIGDYRGFPAYRVVRFTEKPDEAHARQMLAGGDHDWNSGMFIWRIDLIEAEFRKQMPELVARLDRISESWNTAERREVIAELWPGIKPQTIDYGIMEHAQNVAVLPAADLGWNDVGSWDSLFDVLPADTDGNIVIDSDLINVESSQSLVLTQNSNRLIVTIGVEDLVIVDTGDVLMVCDKNKAQLVKKVVDRLKQENRTQFL